MRNLTAFLLVSILLIGCKERIPSEMELYGNTFINIRSWKFEVPSNWVRYNLMDSACSIMMPPYMKETVLDGGYVIDKKNGTNFSFRDTTDSQKHYYSRVAIDYIRMNHGTFAKPDEYVLSTENYMALDKMVDEEIQDRDLILNGPFMDCSTTNLLFDKNNKLTKTYFLDTYYRRKSITGDSPVSVHIYIMQNDDKMVKMMIAYHDKDSVVFNNLFQSIKTFEWNQNSCRR